MITLNQQTEQQLQEIASQTHQSIQQLIELFLVPKLWLGNAYLQALLGVWGI
ncbi:MAG: hypothetical protein Q8N30_16590 [Methylococcales bacterium]|nr:hypothetical protein [Methylococcales bacterium]